mmetsp:Transcript_10271/g.30997  ORF Transcript_10271/g.30997 Transcript_10271/m.30997 type:complete len:420 (+) Transcript_10271:164-1423(+)
MNTVLLLTIIEKAQDLGGGAAAGVEGAGEGALEVDGGGLAGPEERLGGLGEVVDVGVGGADGPEGVGAPCEGVGVPVGDQGLRRFERGVEARTEGRLDALGDVVVSSDGGRFEDEGAVPEDDVVVQKSEERAFLRRLGLQQQERLFFGLVLSSPPGAVVEVEDFGVGADAEARDRPALPVGQPREEVLVALQHAQGQRDDAAPRAEPHVIAVDDDAALVDANLADARPEEHFVSSREREPGEHPREAADGEGVGPGMVAAEAAVVLELAELEAVDRGAHPQLEEPSVPRRGGAAVVEETVAETRLATRPCPRSGRHAAHRRRPGRGVRLELRRSDLGAVAKDARRPCDCARIRPRIRSGNVDQRHAVARGLLDHRVLRAPPVDPRRARVVLRRALEAAHAAAQLSTSLHQHNALVGVLS